MKCLPFKKEKKKTPLVLVCWLDNVGIYPCYYLRQNSVARIMNLNLHQSKNNHERELIELFKTTILHFTVFSGSLHSFLPALYKPATL